MFKYVATITKTVEFFILKLAYLFALQIYFLSRLKLRQKGEKNNLHFFVWCAKNNGRCWLFLTSYPYLSLSLSLALPFSFSISFPLSLYLSLSLFPTTLFSLLSHFAYCILVLTNNFFYSVIFPFSRVSFPFDTLDWGLNPVRVTASYSNEKLAAATIYLLLRSVAEYQL